MKLFAIVLTGMLPLAGWHIHTQNCQHPSHFEQIHK